MSSHARRKDDSSENWRAWKEEATYARLRTIVMAVIASGLVSLFIGYEIETASYNSTAEKAQDNCKLTQRVGSLLTRISKDVANTSSDPAVRDRWSGYAQEFGSTVPPSARVCERVFPLRSRIPFIE